MLDMKTVRAAGRPGLHLFHILVPTETLSEWERTRMAAFSWMKSSDGTKKRGVDTFAVWLKWYAHKGTCQNGSVSLLL